MSDRCRQTAYATPGVRLLAVHGCQYSVLAALDADGHRVHSADLATDILYTDILYTGIGYDPSSSSRLTTGRHA